MLTRSVFLAITIAVLTISNLHAQEELRWKFAPETQRSMIMISESETGGVPGAGSTTKTITRMSWNVDEVDPNGTAHISQKVLRVKTTMNLPGMEPLVHDTDAPAETPNPILAAAIPMYQSLLDSNLTFTMSPQGKIADLDGTEKITQALALSGMQSMSGGKQIMESAAVLFPASVHVGDTWEKEQPLKSPIGAITSKVVYTYDGDVTVSEKVLKKIGMKIEMSLTPSESSPVKMEMTGSRGEGQLLFDNTEGYLVSQTMTTTMTMKVNDTIEMTTVQKLSIKTE